MNKIVRQLREIITGHRIQHKVQVSIMAPIIQTQVTGAAKEAIPSLKRALTV